MTAFRIVTNTMSFIYLVFAVRCAWKQKHAEAAYWMGFACLMRLL